MAYRQKAGVIFSLPTLIYSDCGNLDFPDSSLEVVFHKGVRPILKRLVKEGYFLFLLCNVSDVYYGTMTTDYVYDFLSYFQAQQLPEGVYFSQIYYECDPKSNRFMPFGGMVRDLQSEFNLKPKDLLIVGRNTCDMQCARNTHTDFVGAEVFFNTLVPKRV